MNKQKIIIISLSIILIASLGFNSYNFFNNKAEHKQILSEFRNGLTGFASQSNFKDDNVYNNALSSLSEAFALRTKIDNKNSYSEQEYPQSIPYLVMNLHTLTLQNRDKMNELLNSTDLPELLFTIADNPSDVESIKKAVDILGVNETS